MRNLVFAFLCLFAFVGPSQAQNAGVEATIQRQIEAFRSDDFARAFDFASPTIQGLFGSPERFGAMVRQGYPMVWRPAEVRYLNLRDVAGTLWQRVQITDGAGRVHLLDYQMIQTDGGWKINAVQLLDPPDVAA